MKKLFKVSVALLGFALLSSCSNIAFDADIIITMNEPSFASYKNEIEKSAFETQFKTSYEENLKTKFAEKDTLELWKLKSDVSTELEGAAKVNFNWEPIKGDVISFEQTAKQTGKNQFDFDKKFEADVKEEKELLKAKGSSLFSSVKFKDIDGSDAREIYFNDLNGSGFNTTMKVSMGDCKINQSEYVSGKVKTYSDDKMTYSEDTSILSDFEHTAFAHYQTEVEDRIGELMDGLKNAKYYIDSDVFTAVQEVKDAKYTPTNGKSGTYNFKAIVQVNFKEGVFKYSKTEKGEEKDNNDQTKKLEDIQYGELKVKTSSVDLEAKDPSKYFKVD